MKQRDDDDSKHLMMMVTEMDKLLTKDESNKFRLQLLLILLLLRLTNYDDGKEKDDDVLDVDDAMKGFQRMLQSLSDLDRTGMESIDNLNTSDSFFDVENGCDAIDD